MRLIILLALSAAAAFAQCGALTINPVTGRPDCVGTSGGGGGGGAGVSYCAPASASGTTYTCTPNPALTSYAAGNTLAFVPDVNGTGGATTVNVNALGAKSITRLDGTTNPTSADFVAGSVYTLIYDGTVFRLSTTEGMSINKYTVAYNDTALNVSAGATAKTLATIPARAKIKGITIQFTTAFLATSSLQLLTISLGTSINFPLPVVSGNVTVSSDTGTVTTVGGHGLGTTNAVQLSGCSTTAMNGWWPVNSAPTTTTFTIIGWTGFSSPSTSCTIAAAIDTLGYTVPVKIHTPVVSGNVTVSGDLGTVTTAAAHNLIPGDRAVLSSCATSTMNADWPVNTTPTTTTFTIAGWTGYTTPSASCSLTTVSNYPPSIFDDGGWFSQSMGSHSLIAWFAATGANLSALTAGSVDINVVWLVLP